MKIAVIVILYYPDDNTFANLQSYMHYAEKVYVYDNTPAKADVCDTLAQFPYVVIHHDGENRGISERLNQGCRQAKEDGYKWVMTMDQDTFFAPAIIQTYIQCFKNYFPKEEVAAFGTSYNNLVQDVQPDCEAKEERELITSATIMNLDIWKKTGGFDEALFIDAVDQEYCIRARLAGYKIIRFVNIFVLHTIGTQVYRSSVKSLYTIRKKKYIHSPIRCYYIYRNMLYLEDKYKETNPEISAELRHNAESHLRVCLYYSPERKAIRSYIKIAQQDFDRGQMGKIQPQRLTK